MTNETVYNFNGLQVGDAVIANGYQGTVINLCDWSEGRLVEIQMPRGEICKSAYEVEKVA